MPLTTWVIQKKPQSGEGGGKMHAVGGGGGAGGAGGAGGTPLACWLGFGQMDVLVGHPGRRCGNSGN